MHEEAVKQGKTGKIHIKIDTGMGRIGFAWQEAAEQIKKIYEMKNIFIEGIFTHYASADEKDKQFTLLQQERFESIVCTLNNAGIVIPVKHAANSAAAIDMEQQNMNMIRLGISLYGLYPSQEVQRQKIALKEVMQLRTKVAFVKNVEPGDSISYNRRFTATKPMRVAIAHRLCRWISQRIYKQCLCDDCPAAGKRFGHGMYGSDHGGCNAYCLCQRGRRCDFVWCWWHQCRRVGAKSRHHRLRDTLRHQQTHPESVSERRTSCRTTSNDLRKREEEEQD